LYSFGDVILNEQTFVKEVVFLTGRVIQYVVSTSTSYLYMPYVISSNLAYSFYLESKPRCLESRQMLAQMALRWFHPR